MDRKALGSKLYYRSCCFVLFFVAAAASFNGSFDKWSFDERYVLTKYGISSFESEMDGVAPRPFVYRQLLPTLANWINARFSEQAKDKLFNLKGRTGLLFRERIIDSPIARDRTYFLRYWIVYAAVFLFAWFSVYAMYLVGKAAGFPPAVAALASIAMILLMPYFQDVSGHDYDYPEMAFLMVAVWMAIKLDWWWIIPLAALATFNKESFLFFIPALYPFIRQRSSRASALFGTGVLGLTCAAVYYPLRLRFQQNPGGTVQFHFIDHIRFLPVLFNPMHMVLVRTYGLWAPPTESLLVIALIAWTVWRVWRFLQPAMQRHMQIVAMINFPLFFLFGFPGEVRNLSMLYVTLLILLAASLTEWAGDQAKAATQFSV